MFLSVLAYVNVALMSNPRVMFAMGKDRVIPGFFHTNILKQTYLQMA
jgi:APA family basic amino acid/polyamine antiporter